MRNKETMRQRLDRLEAEDSIGRVAADYHTWRKLQNKRDKWVYDEVKRLRKKLDRINSNDLRIHIS